jgi:hypothetical protein
MRVTLVGDGNDSRDGCKSSIADSGQEREYWDDSGCRLLGWNRARCVSEL